MAAHVAAMAPNTTIGAAHPVAVGGGSIPGIDDGGQAQTMMEKVTNDAVAYIRSLAQLRHRNVTWAERAVRESISSPETEALTEGVVDLVAPDLPSLLAQLDGKTIPLLTTQVTLDTQGATIISVKMTSTERFLYAISDPNIAYLLLSLAMTGLFLEFANPGSILPGIVGGIALLMALFSLGMLPVNYAALLLIALAFILFVSEIWVTSHGMLAIGGAVSLALGSLLLINASAPYLAIDRRLIVGVVLGMTSLFLLAVTAIVRAHRRQATTGRDGLVGVVAEARSPLDPEGQVFLHGEHWRAVSLDGRVEEGEEVKIVRIDGLRLWVTKNR